MAEFAIEELGKGLEKQPDDPRDFQAGFVLGAPKIDWIVGMRLPEPPDQDQGSSLSCVGQAFSYLHWQLRRLHWSVRSLYSRIFLPQGGAYLREGGLGIVTIGQALRKDAPDPVNQTEANMRQRADITAQMEAVGKELGLYAVNAKSPDALAQAIMEAGGVVFGVQGSNPGWADMKTPRPPVFGEQVWGHAIYGFGFHMHGGQKCIIAKSSWCSTGIKEHHIKQNYFDSANTFDGWALIPKEKLMTYRRYVVFDEATARMGVCVVSDTGFADAVIWAKNEAHLAQLKSQYEIPVQALIVTLPRVTAS